MGSDAKVFSNGFFSRHLSFAEYESWLDNGLLSPLLFFLYGILWFLRSVEWFSSMTCFFPSPRVGFRPVHDRPPLL